MRYEAEDLIEKHPWAKSLFIGAMYGLQGAEYAGAAVGGPIGVAVKYASQEAISYAIDTTIEESASKAVEGMAVSPTLREEFKTTLRVSAYTTLCSGSIKASKKLVGTLAKSAKKGVSQKTFTKAEMKEILAGKANDNIFSLNDNNVYMTKGKVAVGESVGVGIITESFIAGPTGRQKKIKISKFLRKGENPSKRPTWRQSEKDDMVRYLKAGYKVQPKAWFKDGVPCKQGTKGGIEVDNYVEGLAAVEMKNYNLTTNSSKLVNNIVEQALKHQQHLPEETRQIFKIDARGQVCEDALKIKITQKIVDRTGGILRPKDIQFFSE